MSKERKESRVLRGLLVLREATVWTGVLVLWGLVVLLVTVGLVDQLDPEAPTRRRRRAHKARKARQDRRVHQDRREPQDHLDWWARRVRPDLLDPPGPTVWPDRSARLAMPDR